MSTDPAIRQTVLRALALNRTPGYHFAGHFLGVSHDHVSVETVRTSMKVGPHCAEANGSINYGALSLFADLSTDWSAKNARFCGARTRRLRQRMAVHSFVASGESTQSPQLKVRWAA